MAPIETIAGEPVRAVIFDMDGVVTDTAKAHFAAWKTVLDQVLLDRFGPEFAPFTREDYLRHVDGVPRHDGIRAFLTSRGIELPEGTSDDAGTDTVRGIGALKTRCFRASLAEERVTVFEDTLAFLKALADADVATGVFSASRNAERVLASAGVSGLFGATVSGVESADLGLAPKPNPAQLVETARRLGAQPAATIVVEDATSGAEAGARGRFGAVIGIARDAGAEQHHALRAAGADIVTDDLGRLLLNDGGLRTLSRLPSAWNLLTEFEARARDQPLAIFLDYDGTLTPIVEDHRTAVLGTEMRVALEALSQRQRVAVVSGRDLADVRKRVGLGSIFYAGSHGFDISGPGGIAERPSEAERLLSRIDAAEDEINEAIRDIQGAEVERKLFSIAIHYRQVADGSVANLEAAIERVAAQYDQLGKSRGKKVIEIQPRVAWDKGRAVCWILDNTPLGEGDPMAIYLGDDLTDEDAFQALGRRGVGIALRGSNRLTLGDYALDDVDDVARFLERLTALPAGLSE